MSDNENQQQENNIGEIESYLYIYYVIQGSIRKA